MREGGLQAPGAARHDRRGPPRSRPHRAAGRRQAGRQPRQSHRPSRRSRPCPRQPPAPPAPPRRRCCRSRSRRRCPRPRGGLAGARARTRCPPHPPQPRARQPRRSPRPGAPPARCPRRSTGRCRPARGPGWRRHGGQGAVAASPRPRPPVKRCARRAAGEGPRQGLPRRQSAGVARASRAHNGLAARWAPTPPLPYPAPRARRAAGAVAAHKPCVRRQPARMHRPASTARLRPCGRPRLHCCRQLQQPLAPQAC